MKVKSSRIAALLTLSAAIGALNGYGQSEQCKTISTNDCEIIGTPCQTMINGVVMDGVITSTQGLPTCVYGEPGNTDCTPDSTKQKQTCYYTCTVTLHDGTEVPKDGQQLQGYPPHLSGNEC